ncbi:MAG: Cof-type HAD-IIB family hydrolase [Firmicutes bacterium]|nr:Cof-type HAD-IIB family hydrolase [Bacillota bacterium]
MKVIFADLDGTLTDDNDRVPKRVALAIAAVRAKGHIVIPISGSSYPWVSEKVSGCELDYIISSNGGRCFDEVNKKVVWHDTIPVETLVALVKEFGKYMPQHHIHHGGNRIDVAPEKLEPHMLEGVSQFTPSLIENKLPNGMAEFMKKHNLHTPYNTFNMARDIYNYGAYMDIVPSFVTKTYAVGKMCKLLGVDKKDTIAIGDGMNDVSLFNACHTKVAVGNAIDEIKSLADIIVGTNNEGGAADFLLTLAK